MDWEVRWRDRKVGWRAFFLRCEGGAEIEVEDVDLSGVSIRYPNVYRQT